MEGHAAMDMSIHDDAALFKRIRSPRAATAISHIFVMEWAAVLRDIAIGLLVTGAIAAWVPNDFWRHLFLTSDPGWSKVWGPLIGPIVSVLSFVCSIGNVPLAGVLWNGGISFGGVVSFIFADLLIIPILNIYRKYYGTRMALYIAGTFYLAMVFAGYAIQLIFGGLGLVPSGRHAKVIQASVQWNYTTVLNIVFLALAAALVYRFVTTDGLPMLRMMGGGPGDEHGHCGDNEGHQDGVHHDHRPNRDGQRQPAASVRSSTSGAQDQA
jgi:uncharacterized membrane protein YraQ (UPF0718 family)